MVRKFVPFIIAGALGGLITLAGVKLSDKPLTAETQRINPVAWGAPTASSVNFDFAAASAKAMPSVVQIHTNLSREAIAQQRKEQQENSPFGRFFEFFGENMPFSFGIPGKGAGSGVIISPDGYIVTNNHVVENFDEIEVTTLSGDNYTAQVIGRDPATDLAVVKINANNLPVMEYANSDDAKVGEWVLAVGNPYEKLRSTVTAGIISAKGRDLNILRGEKTIESFIQTDAAVNPGNSGGALVDIQGRLLGINTAIYSETGAYVGYSFAVPSNLMKKVVEEIVKNGDIKRVTLGVSVVELNEQVANDLNVKINQGLFIENVADRSSAQYAGLLPNDVILEVNGKKTIKFTDLSTIIDNSRANETIKIKVWRDGEPKTIDVRLRSKI